MPKIVDHDQRRRELARAAVRVIGRDGLDAATTHAVAVECGWSTGVPKHYFRNKDELLYAALRELELTNLERFEAAEDEATGFEAIRAAIVAMVTGDRDRLRVWISFLGRACTDPAVATTMRRGIQSWTDRWAELVRRGQDDGSITRGLDPDQTAIELYALVNGLGISSLFQTSPSASSTGGNVTFLDHLRSPSNA